MVRSSYLLEQNQKHASIIAEEALNAILLCKLPLVRVINKLVNCSKKN